jgi:lipopolysaccharide export system ATP-binding protein
MAPHARKTDEGSASRPPSSSHSERAPIDTVALAATGIRVHRDGKDVLRGIDLAAHAGEVLGVLGPSGAGKSTLFGTLVGEFLPDAGKIMMAGRDITRWPLWRRARAGIGYVPQGPSVLWDLTVRENLETFGRIAGVPPGDVDLAAGRVGLQAQMNVMAKELSGGERRRLELARAMTRQPKVLVCDEPFAGVDPAATGRLGELLADLARAGTAVLLADHHVAEALCVCHRAVLLLDGAIAAEASATAFAELPLVRERYLGR